MQKTLVAGPFRHFLKTTNNWLLLTEANLNRNYFASHLAADYDNGVYK